MEPPKKIPSNALQKKPAIETAKTDGGHAHRKSFISKLSLVRIIK